MDWMHDSTPPRFGGPKFSQVWLDDGSVRRVLCVGDGSRIFSPGELVFIDCTHPAQNAVCDRQRIVAWRPKVEDAR